MSLAHAGPVPFEAILDELEQLSREHLLFYRVQVGDTLLRHFYQGDAAAYAKRGASNAFRFDAFFDKYKAELDRYGLSKHQARSSIRACIVVRSLPSHLTKQLFIGQVLQLARLTDPTQRARLAGAAIAQDWSVQQLRDAISAVQAGLPLDSDEATPGIQISAPPQTGPKPVPGRLVTRAERMVETVDTWTTQWSQVDGSRLRPPQRRRLMAAVEALEAKVQALRASLAEGPGRE